MRGVQRCPCGQVIVFVRDAADPSKWQVLDVSSAPYLYRVEWAGLPEPVAVKQLVTSLPSHPGGDQPMLISHFRTCTKVKEFAASLKRLEAEGEKS